MKKTHLVLLVLLTFLSLTLLAEVRISKNNVHGQQASGNSRVAYCSVDLSNGVFPPAGWSISAQASHWSASATANAGGSAPEINFNYNPQFTGDSRLVSPVINTSGQTSLTLEFKHMVDWYANPFTVGVATRSNNGPWNVAWSVDPHANITENRSITIETTDVGSETFQFCFYFTGNSYNIDDWWIDNILLYSPEQHDFKPVEIIANWQYPAGQAMTPTVKVKNNGLTDDTGNVICKIYQFETEIYNQTVSSTINSGQTIEVTFPAFTPEVDNEMYQMVFITNLDTDLDHSNDSLATDFNTYNIDRENVLLEIGTGTWCGYCPGAAMGADDLVENGHSVAVLEYHNGDPYTTDETDARNDYYAITGFPTAIFDGLDSVVGGNHTQSMYPTYLPIYEELIPVKTNIEMGFQGELNNDGVLIRVNIVKLGRLLDNSLKLHVGVTESEMQVAWQGQTQLDFVVRDMVPDANGTDIDLVTNDNLSIDVTSALNPSWVNEHLEIVAFIQDPTSKIVYQAIKCKLDELAPLSNNDLSESIKPVKLYSNYPNPFNPTTNIKFAIDQASNVTLDIYNQKGQKVNTLVNGMREKGNHNVVWNGKDANGNQVSSGIYYYQLRSNNQTVTKKMVLMK